MSRFCAWLVILSLNLPANGQKTLWSIEPSLGLDLGGAIPFPLSDIPEGSGGTPKTNPMLGVAYNYNFETDWSLGFEINYHLLDFSAKADVLSQPFYFDNGTDVLYFTGETKADVELRMIEFPVVVSKKLGKNWHLQFAPYYTRILEGTFHTEGKNGFQSDDKSITDNVVLPGPLNVEYNFDEFLSSYDYGLLVGYKYSITEKLFFYGRLHVGLKSIFRRDFNNIDYEMYQMRISGGVTYRLFASKKLKKDRFLPTGDN